MQWLLCASLVALCGACATAGDVRPDYIAPGATDLRVESLEIRGVERLSLDEIRRGLATQEDPGWRGSVGWLPFVGKPRQYFNRLEWRRDRERILTFYRRRGYYHTHIRREYIREFRERSAVRISLTVVEGEPVRVAELDAHGLDGLEATERQRVWTDLPVRVGDVFREDAYLQARSELVRRLGEEGYAYADVTGRVVVTPEENRAQVAFYVEPGPRAFYGAIAIEGLERIPDHVVREAMALAPGEPFVYSALQEAQQDIYNLGVFSLVTVLPAPTSAARERLEPGALGDRGDETASAGDDATSSEAGAPGSAEGEAASLGISDLLQGAQRSAAQRSALSEAVPIQVRLKEANVWNVRVGAGLAAETTRQEIRARLNWGSRNFLGGLRRLEHFNAVGYAWSPSFLSDAASSTHGVTLSSELRVSQPQFLERLTSLRLTGRLERDVREGFTVWNPSARLGLDRPFWRRLFVEGSYNLSYFRYSNVEPGLEATAATVLGLDFEPRFVLEYLEQALSLDFRDDALDPRKGFLLRLSVQESGNFLAGGKFDFVKPVLYGAGYVPVGEGRPLVVAFKGRLGTVYDIGEGTGIPVQSRLYGGGKDSVRSFGGRRLSLYTPAGEPVPVGGLTQLEVSLEPRLRLISNAWDVGDVWGALYVDAGTVLAAPLLWQPALEGPGAVGGREVWESMMYGAGAGLWWLTPVGPVRLDLAYTLSETSGDARFRRCVDPSTAGTPACTFVPLAEDPVQELLGTFAFYVGIGHAF